MKLAPVIRRALEQFSRRIVLMHRLPDEFGGTRLIISPGAALTYWRGLRNRDFNDLYDFCRLHVRQDDIVWDVGANMGLLSFAAAHQVGAGGHVLAFEPDWWSGQLLHRSRLRNPHLAERIQVVSVAVAETMTLQTLIIPQRSRAASHLESAGGASVEMTGGPRDRLLVPTVTLDWVAGFQPTPSVIKIDVDGAEFRVLTGAKTILTTKRPKILVEVYERNADAVGSLLRGLGYSLFSYEQGEAGCQSISRPTYNTLALPN